MTFHIRDQVRVMDGYLGGAVGVIIEGEGSSVRLRLTPPVNGWIHWWTSQNNLVSPLELDESFE